MFPKKQLASLNGLNTNTQNTFLEYFQILEVLTEFLEVGTDFLKVWNRVLIIKFTTLGMSVAKPDFVVERNSS